MHVLDTVAYGTACPGFVFSVVSCACMAQIGEVVWMHVAVNDKGISLCCVRLSCHAIFGFLRC